MNISHILYLSISIIFVPMLAFSQTKQKDDEVIEKKRYYITKSGQKTLIVNDVQGLESPNAKFLTKEGYIFSDDLGDKYEYLNQAARDVDEISKELKAANKYFEQDSIRTSLAFINSESRLEKLRKQRMNEAKVTKGENRINILKNEKLFLEDRFDGKPSYFINNQQVSSELAEKLTDKEILNRFFKVDNTVTGNPNGEIWFTVNSKTISRLGLDNSEGDEINRLDITVKGKVKSKLSLSQSEEVEELRKELENLRLNQDRLKSELYNQETARTEISANNHKKIIYEEVIGFKDSPQERARRARDLEEKKKESEFIQEDEPVRSVKRIKERERNR